MQLVITVKEGATNTDIARQLRHQANLIDGMEPKEASAKTSTPVTQRSSTKKTAAPAASVDDDDDFKAEVADDAGFDDGGEEAASEEFEGEEEAKPAKKAAPAKTAPKTKKITLDDVNDACKAYAKVHGRDAVLEKLQKKFKTQSVTALKADQYAACIALMAIEEE